MGLSGGKLRRFTFTTRDGVELACYRAEPQPPARGVVFLPTLVGGSYLQQFTYFEPLLADGFFLLSFHYRGHRFSKGIFTLRRCLDDAAEVVQAQRREFSHLPFFAIGTCFGTIPILSIQHRYPGFFKKIAMANGVLHYKQAVGGLRFAMGKYGYKVFVMSLARPRQLLRTVMMDFFPSIDQSDEHFGNLNLNRMKERMVLGEYVLNRALPWNWQIDAPVLFIVGTQDHLLRFDQEETRQAYINNIRRHFSQFQIKELPSNHFFDGYTVDVARSASDFFSQDQIKVQNGEYRRNQHSVTRPRPSNIASLQRPTFPGTPANVLHPS